MGLFGMSDREIWKRIDDFKILYFPAMALMNDSSLGLETRSDASIRAHISELKAMAVRVRREHTELSDLAPRARDEGLRVANQIALKDIQEVIDMLDESVRRWEALLAFRAGPPPG